MRVNRSTKLLGTVVSLCFSLNVLGAIDGYIGNQSFKLGDDRKLQKHRTAVSSAKSALESRQANFNAQKIVVQNLKASIKNSKNSIAKKNQKISSLKNAITALQSEKKSLKASLKSAETPEQKKEIKAKIASVTAKIDSSKSQTQTLKGQVSSLTQTLKAQKAGLQTEEAKLQVKKQELETSKTKLASTTKERDRYRKALVNRILQVNKRGAVDGKNDGQEDGIELAMELGRREGRIDGDDDGELDGKQAGRKRDYRRGYQNGEEVGTNRAQDEGQVDGTRLGTIEGNKVAASREGTAAGIVRANNSNASQVGTDQGVEAGYQRAVKTGDRVGTQNGEDQAIDKHESAPLNSVQLSGAFAASFDRNVPTYPGPTHDNYDTFSSHSYSREVVRKAYIDGYKRKYRTGSKSAFNNKIDGYYTTAYDNSYDRSYEEYYNNFYQQRYNSGQVQGERDAFASVYPGVKERYRNIFKEQFSENPNRNSSEFKTTYASSEHNSYRRRFESIRSEYFDQFEERTFAANIEEQTEKYRRIRFNSVNATYSSNPVLAFVSSEMKDGGIRNVAKLDGVFQPGETTLHSVIVKNFGNKEAKGVTATLSSGQKVTLPSIPAKSIATIKGAATGKIQEELTPGSNETLSLSIKHLLTAEAKIQGRHYDSVSQGLVKSNAQHRVRVNYPLSLTSLSTVQQLVKGSVTPLNVTVNNNSKRDYKGPIVVGLSSNREHTINTDFSPVSKLGKTVTLRDATLLVNSTSDIYTPISFTAEVRKNGVLLGKLDRSFTTLAKSKFINKKGTPVLVADSNSSAAQILDVIEDLGGIENVSILDTSLASLNNSHLKSALNKRVAMVMDSGNGHVLGAINEMIKSSKNLVLLMLGQDSRGLEKVRTSANFNEGHSQKFKIKGMEEKLIVSSNPHQNKAIKGATLALSARTNDFSDELYLADLFTLSADEHIAKIASEINHIDYFDPTPRQATLASSIHVRSVLEIILINIAYDKSKKPGLFGTSLFGKRDKKWYKMIEKGDNLFIHRLKRHIESAAANREGSGGLLAGYHNYYAVENALKYYRPIQKDILTKIKSKAVEVVYDAREVAIKKLKKIDKKFWRQAFNKKHIYTPFKPGSERDCMPGNPNFPRCQYD